MDFLQYFQGEFQTIFLEFYLCSAAMILLLYGVIYSTSSNHSFPILIRPVTWMTVLSFFFGFLILLNTPTNPFGLLNNLVIHDEIALFGKFIILFSSLSCLVISVKYFSLEKISFFEYSILLLLASVGMIAIVSSYDIMTMYLSIEFQSLCLYVLAAFKRNSLFSAEAGLKYFILGAFSSGILLFGISLLYGFTGCTNFEDISRILSYSLEHSSLSNGVLLSIIFIGSGLLFKIYSVPFHVWVPDVYQGSPTPVTAFFATVPSVSILILMIRLFHIVFFEYIDYWQPFILVCSILSMLVGSFMALNQVNIKRLIAYSAISHVGYILIGFATGTSEGISSILIYVFIYVLMNICLFTVLLFLRKQKGNIEIESINDLSGLYKKNAGISVVLAIIFFSLSGIPPLAGFFSKLYIFLSAIHTSLYLPVIVGIFSSVISSVYYLRIIKLIYFNSPQNWFSLHELDKLKAFYISIVIFFLLFFFIYSSPLLIITNKISLITNV